MNREIEKYYIDRIDENQAEDFIKEALVTGIRSDNVELIRKAADALPFCGEFYGYSSPLEFAIKEMASTEVIKVLLEAGYELSKPCHDLTPFSGSPQELVELWMEGNGKTKEEAIRILAGDIAYFFHVIKTDYSCYRIPYGVDSEDRYKPCFWNYLDEWMVDFLRLLACETKSEWIDFYFGRNIIENVELENAFDTLFELSGQHLRTDILNIKYAVGCDNEHAFEKLIKYNPALIKEVDCYPSTSKKILSAIFDAGLLQPGTAEGFNAFIPFISYGKTDKDILTSVVHPSYSRCTIKNGVTPLMVAVKNEEFPVELYKLLITSPDDVNMQDEKGQTALHYMAKTEYPECIESLLELGADPFITDNKGNNVIHALVENKQGLSLDILGDCISLLSERLLDMKNNNGMTPVALFLRKLIGAGKQSCHKVPFSQFLKNELSSPESLNGNILIGGACDETRIKILSIVRQHVINLLKAEGYRFAVFPGKFGKIMMRHLEMIADGRIGTKVHANGKLRFYVIIFEELYDCQSGEFHARLEACLKRLSEKDNVLIIAASKFSSADIITDIIQNIFPYRITALQSSDISSEIILGNDDAAYIGKDEVIVKGFGDDLLLCNLESDENESEGNESKSFGEMDEDSIVLAEAERILDKHLSAFKELAR